MLGGNLDFVVYFKGGKFVIIYLLFKDYYCIYMLIEGIFIDMVYVFGELFLVNLFIVENVLGLFVCNECVVILFDILVGKMVIVLVGVIIVVSIDIVWVGIVMLLVGKYVMYWCYDVDGNDVIIIGKGEEMG